VGLVRADTQTTAAERGAIDRHARGRTSAAEIGVWHGVTTRRLRATLAPDGELWTVDPYPLGRFGVNFARVVAQREVGAVKGARVRWVRTTGVDAARLWSAEARRPIEFVFIDADHSWEGLSGDWNAWSGLVARGGVVALHDSRSTPEHPLDDTGSVRFTQQVIRQDARYRVIDEVDSLTVLERVTVA
jgi:predicted O-methyltransferase YrrM